MKQITYREAQELRKVLARKHRKENKNKALPVVTPMSAEIQEVINLFLERG